MSAARHDAVLALLVAGVAVAVVSALAVLALPGVLDRLHALAPVTSISAPLIGAALVVQNGWGLTSGQVILITVLLVVTGPVISGALGRAAIEQQRGADRDRPE